MNVFLTGATGFIGRHLAVRLADAGHQVLCLVRNPGKAPWMGEHRGLEVVQGDLGYGELIRSCLDRSDLVFHLAALTKAVRREDYFEINGRATGDLSHAARSSGVKIVYLSSLAAAGPRENVCSPEDRVDPAPVTPYGESKLLGEELLKERCRGGSWTILRAPAVYGPYDRDMYLLFKMASRGIIPLLNRGMSKLSLIHVDDLVEALMLAGFSDDADRQTYQVSDGQVRTAREISEMLQTVAGRGIIVPVPVFIMRSAGLFSDVVAWLRDEPSLLNSDKVKDSLQPGWVCGMEKISEELGFAPRIGFEEGFISTYRWYREQGLL